MKRIFTLLSFFLPLFVFGQSFEITPSEDIFQEYPINVGSADYIHVKNVSGAPITLNYQTLSNSFLSGWTINFCVGINCYNSIPFAGQIATIANGEESSMACNMGFGDNIGEGTVVFRIYDENDPTNSDTISVTYNVVEEITGTTNLDNDYKFKISPNPTISDLNLVNSQLENYEVSVYSLTGQLILNEKVSGKFWHGDLSNQSNGIYILTIMNEEGLVFREIVSKI